MLRDTGTGGAGGAAALSSDELADEITTLSAHMSAAMCRWLTLVAEFDRREAWADWGCRSCAHWIGWRCSIAPGPAREHVRVARKLEGMRTVCEAFGRGELSYSKVRALTRLDSVRDGDDLVALAKVHTAAQLEKVVRTARRVSTDEAAAAHASRRLILEPRDDGTMAVRGRLTAEEGAVLRQALDLAVEALVHDGEVAEGAAPSATAADALMRLADAALALGGAPGRPGADRHEVVVHVDAADLVGSDAVGDGVEGAPGAPTVAGEMPIAAESAKRLCCDAGIVVTADGPDGEPLAVGRRTRTIPPAVRRALRSRDGGCRFPGCTASRWVDAHHIVHWADGGATGMENLVLLCRHHHRLVHEHGFSVAVRSTAPFALEFRAPGGTALEASPGCGGGRVRGVVAGNRARGVRPGPMTPVPGWAGESFDLGLSVDAFLGLGDGP